MLVENADEPYAAELANAIVMERKKGNTIDTTKKLYRIIEDTIQNVVKKEKGCKDQSEDVKMIIKKTAQRTFQAIRIDVNSEFEVLDAFLEKLPGVLKTGGRVAILTFHSGEDRMVKKAFKRHLKAGEYSDIAKDVIRPSKEECYQNSRARSTKMRWAVKS